MVASQKRAQQGAEPSDVSLVGINESLGAEGGVILDTVVNDVFAHRRADELDAEAVYYRYRATQEEQALGPGYYVDLLRGMATDRAAMAQRIRTRNGAT
jgi:hypothetical protein